uniref:YCII-related n=1 Tax=Cyanothece sp. (strain PCC 7425 / ATCC 29141) TaxID=395961 RepID=B8HM58_CYAP4
MKVALRCTFASHSFPQYTAVQQDHLRYLEAHKEQIVCSGVTLHEDGSPSILLIMLEVSDLGLAESFIEAEPYNQAGCFEQVVLRLLNQTSSKYSLQKLLHC